MTRRWWQNRIYGSYKHATLSITKEKYIYIILEKWNINSMKIKKFHLHFSLFILTTWVDILHHIVLDYYNSSVAVSLRF